MMFFQGASATLSSTLSITLCYLNVNKFPPFFTCQSFSDGKSFYCKYLIIPLLLQSVNILKLINKKQKPGSGFCLLIPASSFFKAISIFILAKYRPVI